MTWTFTDMKCSSLNCLSGTTNTTTCMTAKKRKDKAQKNLLLWYIWNYQTNSNSSDSFMHLLQTWFPVACFPFLYLYISLLINRCAYAADREVTLRGRSTNLMWTFTVCFFLPATRQTISQKYILNLVGNRTRVRGTGKAKQGKHHTMCHYNPFHHENVNRQQAAVETVNSY